MDQGNIVCSGIREGRRQFRKGCGRVGRYTQPLLAVVGNWPPLIGGSPSIRPTLPVGQFLYHFNFFSTD